MIMGNNPIPPRSRARCFADSPRRGEYGSLCTRLRRGGSVKSVGVEVEVDGGIKPPFGGG
jgi:hypothetical protein